MDGTLPPGARGFGQPHSGSVPGPPWRGTPTTSTTLVPPGARTGAPSDWRGLTASHRDGPRAQDSYLVDSASSHMLVSKIKPCMSKYKQLYGETANGSLNQLSFI